MNIATLSPQVNADTWEGYADFATGDTPIEKYYAAVGSCMAEAFRSLQFDQPDHLSWEHGLDIACGDGKSTRLMAQFCRQMTGVDSSRDLIHQAQQMNQSQSIEFLLSSFEAFAADQESMDVVGATWFLNHVHSIDELRLTIEKIHRMMRPSGAFAFVVPADSFTSQRSQTLAREHFGWRQAWTESTAEFTRGVFSFGNQWIETTIWQPMLLARLLAEHFEIRFLDVKSTLINQHLLDEMQTEPPFEVIYGFKRESSVQTNGRASVAAVKTREAKSIQTSKVSAEANAFANNHSGSDGLKRSYSAGSTSGNANSFRVVKNDLPNRIATLAKQFPTLKQHLDRPMIVSAYPASLGLDGLGPVVDTFLHPPAFFRALNAAAVEDKTAVITSQPLAGADLMLQSLDVVEELPEKILWAIGGYYLPASLERTVVHAFASRGTHLDVLQCYGVAQLAHTCLAANERDEAGWPRFLPVVPGLNVSTDEGSGELVLRLDDQVEQTGDQARKLDGSWQVISNVHRLDPRVRQELESWSMFDWTRRTGYLSIEGEKVTVQLRAGIKPASSSQLSLNEFWQKFGGGWTMKPDWGKQRNAW